MYIRCAFFEGRVKPGCDDAFDAFEGFTSRSAIPSFARASAKCAVWSPCFSCEMHARIPSRACGDHDGIASTASSSRTPGGLRISSKPRENSLW